MSVSRIWTISKKIQKKVKKPPQLFGGLLI